MPETDVTKMKVADLKRELKLRGLSVVGNKTELQDRLQAALLDGDISLEDSHVDELLDDGVLSDEEDIDSKILQTDDELLKSPLPPRTPEAADGDKNTTDDDILESPTVVVKKISLKRQSSSSIKSPETEKSKENTEPTKPKVIKMSEKNPITMGDSKPASDQASVNASPSGVAKKVSELTLEERLAIRAKKFGITTVNKTSDSASAELSTALVTTPKSNQSIDMSSISKVPDEKQVELLKKRAERFGCVLSSQIAKIENQERLLKRKERFSSGAVSSTTNSSSDSEDWKEKARKRLERFSKTAEGTTNGSTIEKVEAQN